MNNIYLPTLNSIHIKDFSLYPNGLDYKYKFVKGVNLILGGNGLGKTTFINLIKYGLIGLYKKDLGFVRTYRERSIETRRQLPAEYFKNRMNNGYEKNEYAKIILNFTIQDTTFEVTRNLFDIVLEKVVVSEKNKKRELEGEIINQNSYEHLDDSEKKKYLQHNYEIFVAKRANVFSFDDLIFFVNEILTFGENHKTILWEEGNEQIQERLSSKYFNDPQLDFEREEAIRKSKYHNSLARHKSEDIRAINEVIDRLEVINQTDKDFKKNISKIEELKITLGKQKELQKKIHEERKKLFDNRSLLNAERNKLSKNIETLEKELSVEIARLNDERWFSLNQKYQVYIDNVHINKLCPMCNQELTDNEFKSFKHAATTCFVCHKPIVKFSGSTPIGKKIENLNEKLKDIYKNRQICEIEVINLGKEIKAADEKYDNIEKNLWNVEKELRDLEYATGQNKPGESFELKALKKQIDDFEREKIKLLEKSEKEKVKAETINEKMENANTRIAKDLSLLFSNYSQKFLGLKSELIYDELGDVKGKRFLPIIDNKIRMDSEALSESQRFFVDHAYRMSLLTLFHEQPTFYICETPDSSLDISYERNAADVFIEYLKNPNSLVITSNLNNSEFLDHIVDKASKINYINLFEISQKSHIQSTNKEIDKILRKIMDRINAKHN